MMRFNIGTHSVTGQPMVEVFIDDILMGCIYGDASMPSLRVVSKYLATTACVVDHAAPQTVLLPFLIG